MQKGIRVEPATWTVIAILAAYSFATFRVQLSFRKDLADIRERLAAIEVRLDRMETWRAEVGDVQRRLVDRVTSLEQRP